MLNNNHLFRARHQRIDARGSPFPVKTWRRENAVLHINHHHNLGYRHCTLLLRGKQEVTTGEAVPIAQKIGVKKPVVTRRYVFSTTDALFEPLQIRAQ
ncbi:hypothetical protein ACU9CO_003018 [Cronobacter dublinensis]